MSAVLYMEKDHIERCNFNFRKRVTYFERGGILAHVIQPMLQESFSMSYRALWQYGSKIGFMCWLVGE